NKIEIYIVILIAALYTAVSLATLTKFPFVHFDEPWLSGLSRNISFNGDFSVTEPFFDLWDRYPHAIKIIFHSIQIIFMKLMGYNIFTFRFISFLFGMLCLFMMYKLGRLIFTSKLSAWSAVILLALDIQFIYASHFARQEIIILFVLLLGLWYTFKHSSDASLKHDIILGSIIGLSIGIHPNSFIISLPFGLIYLYEIFAVRKRKLSSLIALVCTVGLFAALFVGISLYFDPDFVTNYSKSGNQFGVFNPLTSKLSQIKLFYQKFYFRESGTYYMPDIILQFYLFPAALVLSIVKLFAGSDAKETKIKLVSLMLSLAAINTGIILIGRFNQTSIILIFPLFYLLMAYLMQSLTKVQKYITLWVLAAALSASSVFNFLQYSGNSYEKYLNQLSYAVSPHSKVLAHLNTGYYFDNDKLHDFRNLSFLKEKGISFEEYIESNDIEYIVYPEELDLMQQLPEWYSIYGPMDYYDEMQKFIKENCQQVYEYTDAYYGIGISKYIGTKDWKIRIYKVTKQ
ncbi:MAG: hypothetical protein K0R84_1870, partial [Clostridia bacterium]|nr:hypothetical protein [Clostridia bacterium]